MNPQSLDDLPTDKQFENSLLELLNTTKYEVYDIHGPLMDAWYADKDAGPLMMFVLADIVTDNYLEDLDTRYPKVTIFSMFLNNTSLEERAYYLIFSHDNFYSVALFGQELTPAQFTQAIAASQ